jgi:Rrf2 family protein
MRFARYSVLEDNYSEQYRASMLTNKGKYALKAMLHLGSLRENEIAQVTQIAHANNIPKKFLDQILADLRNVGLVHSTKGRKGGYALAKPAKEIQVGQIIRAIDGPIAPHLCASRTAYRPCDDCDEEVCAVRQLMIEARNALSSVLDTQTLADMLAPIDVSNKAGQIANETLILSDDSRVSLNH